MRRRPHLVKASASRRRWGLQADKTAVVRNAGVQLVSVSSFSLACIATVQAGSTGASHAQRSARPFEGQRDKETTGRPAPDQDGADFARLWPAQVFVLREPGRPGARYRSARGGGAFSRPCESRDP